MLFEQFNKVNYYENMQANLFDCFVCVVIVCLSACEDAEKEKVKVLTQNKINFEVTCLEILRIV